MQLSTIQLDSIEAILVLIIVVGVIWLDCAGIVIVVIIIILRETRG